ncbi:hypothetical protein [Pyrodictium abyssi]|uniref:Uncharacterized protein n=1 Tax=Pyrodictium abyssi TaxID=54256 RepID=A0ABM8IYY3_9CREN|nr:hypothetical protein PABY_23200 [Pyrodictium abyssi]
MVAPGLDLTTAKALAALGLVASTLSPLHGALGLIGLALYIAGMYYVAEYYGRREVFHYVLVSTVGFTAALIAIAPLVGVGAFLGAPTAGPIGLGVSIAAGLALAYIAVLFMGKYKRDLMKTLAPHSDRGIAEVSVSS